MPVILFTIVNNLWLASCAYPTAKPPANAEEFQTNSEYQILVNLPDASVDELEIIINAIAKEYSLTQVNNWPIVMLGIHCYVLAVQDNVSPGFVVSRLLLDPRVESVQTMNTFQVMARKYDDPYLKLQYSIQSSHVESAHKFSTGKGVNVAVIDSGVDAKHLDLRGRIAQNKNFVTTDYPQGEIHGTAIAGVIAAKAGNREGIVGVAPDVNILALKACWQLKPGGGEAVCSSFTLAKAINFALKEGANIINMSLGGPEDPLLTRLVKKALELGVVVVAAKD
jgi:subtilisin family serine protease